MLSQAVGFSADNLVTETYLICTTQRSGSNLLCQVLTDSNVAGKPGEFFSDKLRTRLAGTLSLQENLAPIEFFRAAIRRTTGVNGLFGAKIMRRHLQHSLEVTRSAFGISTQASDLAVQSANLGAGEKHQQTLADSSKLARPFALPIWLLRSLVDAQE